MKYIYQGQEFDYFLEQDGRVGDLIIQVVTKEPTENETGERLHIANPTLDDNGNYIDGDIVARVILDQLN